MIGAGVGEILEAEIGDVLVPALLARPGVERHQVVVGRLHVEIVVPHPEAAIGDVRAAPGLPVVMPHLAPVARVHRPGVVRHREVERAVDDEHRALDGATAAGDEVASAFAADDYRAAATSTTAETSRTSRPLVQFGHPGEREVLDRRLVDLFQRAITLASVIAGIRRPHVGERLEQIGWRDALALGAELSLRTETEKNGQECDRCGEPQFFERHFKVTRYAVTSCMSLSV